MIRVAWLVAAGACSASDGGPRLDAVTPMAAAGGALVSLTGTRLCGGDDCTEVPATVAFGIDPPMVDAVVVTYADTNATVVVPSIVASGETWIIVTVGDQSSNALDFEVLAP